MSLVLLWWFVCCAVAWECTDANVKCVSTDVAHHATIGDAYADCGTRPGGTVCVIMLSEDLSPYDEMLTITTDESNGFSEKAEIIPFDNEDVVWKHSSSDSVIIFSGVGVANWKVHSGGNGGTLTFVGASAGEAILNVLSESTGIHFADLTIEVEDGIFANGIRLGIGGPIDGVTIERVRFLEKYWGLGGGFFTHIAVYGTGTGMSAVQSHRVIIQNCEFLGARGGSYLLVEIEESEDILITGNYFAHENEFMVGIGGTPNVEISNNVFNSSGADGTAIEYGYVTGFLANNLGIMSNTFHCDSSIIPTNGLIRFRGNADASADPRDVAISNNLFVGACGSTTPGEEIVRDGGSCAVGRCLSDASTPSYMIANRATNDLLFLPTTATITVDNAAGDGGANQPIVLVEQGNPNEAYPWFYPETDYAGSLPGGGRVVTSDLRGLLRSATTPTLGAFEFDPECDSVFVSTSATAGCNEQGTCILPETCDCFGNGENYTGTYCDVFVCYGEEAGTANACTSAAHGTCIAPHSCACVSGTGWEGDECGACNSNWEVTTGCISCASGTGWEGSSCDVCNAHWDESDDCASCTRDWEGTDCATSVAGGGGLSTGGLAGIIAGAVVGPLLVVVVVVVFVVVICCFVRRKAPRMPPIETVSAEMDTTKHESSDSSSSG